MPDVPNRNSRFDRDPAGYDRLRQGWMQRRRIDRILASVEGIPSGSTVAEIGSGTGAVLAEIAMARPDLSFVGIEPIPGYVDHIRQRVDALGLTNVAVHVGTAEDARSIGIEGVAHWWSSDVLHHVGDLSAAVDAITGCSAPDATWLVIEPNMWNPYVAVFQALTPGERNFRPGQFAAVMTRAGWSVVRRSHLFLIPAAIRTPPRWLQRSEGILEGWRLLGGGVALECVRRG